jgi:two-component system OmpR family sensor kinase
MIDRLAVLAHELRSPVAALVAIAEAFRASDAAQRARLRELAAAACLNIERLVLDASVASVRLERLDVGRIASDAAAGAVLGGALVRVVVDADVPHVSGDPQRLRQALDNLIGNAVGHAPAGSEVLVSVRSAGSRVLLSVADQGEGIPQHELARVFEPGVRLTRARPGSGLGLAIVRAIVDAHGGHVEIDSAAGQGATFTLALPACDARA